MNLTMKACIAALLAFGAFASYLLAPPPEQRNCFSAWQAQESQCPEYDYASAEGHFPDAFGVQQKVRMTAVIAKSDHDLQHVNLYFAANCHAQLKCETSEVAAQSLLSSLQHAIATLRLTITELPDEDSATRLFGYIKSTLPSSVTISLTDVEGLGETIYFKQVKAATSAEQSSQFTYIEIKPGLYKVCKLNPAAKQGHCENVQGTMSIMQNKGVADLKHSFGPKANNELFAFLHKFYQQERAMACELTSECNAEGACTVAADCTKS